MHAFGGGLFWDRTRTPLPEPLARKRAVSTAAYHALPRRLSLLGLEACCPIFWRKHDVGQGSTCKAAYLLSFFADGRFYWASPSMRITAWWKSDSAAVCRLAPGGMLAYFPQSGERSTCATRTLTVIHQMTFPPRLLTILKARTSGAVQTAPARPT
jgi:hypothetical protein